MTLFRLDASIRTDGSASREIADIVEAEWLAAYPAETIERRHIGVDVLPADAWAQAIAASSVPAENRSAEQRAAVALAAALVDELVAADAILLAVPLYNFGVSQHVKTWMNWSSRTRVLWPARHRCSRASRSCSARCAAGHTAPERPAKAGTTRPAISGASCTMSWGLT